VTSPLESRASELVQRPPSSFWSAVGEALRGTHQDFTTGPIPRAILLLAVPMVLEMALESVFAVTDVFFVGRLGAGAVATVGLTESVISLVYALAMGLSVGATATVARRIGEHDADGAASTAVQAVTLGLIASVLLGVIGALAAPHVLTALGAEPAVVALGSNYTRIMYGGSGTILMLFLVNAIFRGAGDAAIAMRVLWLSNAINILLGPCLIFGLGPFPRLGVTGAAVATTLGRATGAIFAISRLARRGGRIQIRRRHLRLEPAVMMRLIRLSGSGALQSFIGTASWIGLVKIAAFFGSAVLAGYTIGIRIIVFALLPSFGLSNAAATMVGQALGAKEPERGESAVWLAARYDCAALTVVGILFFVAAAPIAGVFSSDPSVVRTAGDLLRIVALGFPFYAYGMVVTQSFNGAGDTWTPTLLNIVVFWMWEIPLAYVLAKVPWLGPRGIFVAITIGFSTLAVVSALVFRRGRWKRVVV
jgi:putative MATE family efflux protein